MTNGGENCCEDRHGVEYASQDLCVLTSDSLGIILSSSRQSP
jgi:hypothetical protein